MKGLTFPSQCCSFPVTCCPVLQSHFKESTILASWPLNLFSIIQDTSQYGYAEANKKSWGEWRSDAPLFPGPWGSPQCQSTCTQGFTGPRGISALRHQHQFWKLKWRQVNHLPTAQTGVLSLLHNHMYAWTDMFIETIFSFMSSRHFKLTYLLLFSSYYMAFCLSLGGHKVTEGKSSSK